MMMCVVQSYCMYYLFGASFSASEAGVLAAAACAAAMVLQPVIGRIADTSTRTNWKQMLTVLSLLCAGTLLAAMFSRTKPGTGFFFAAAIMLVNALYPLTNACSFYYEEHGEHVNFGVARGVGSLSFAVLSIVLGRLTLTAGRQSVPASGLAAITCLILVTLTMPLYGKEKKAGAAKPAAEGGAGKKKFVLKRYPAFFLMVAACLLALTFHNMYSYYMINLAERAGGNSGTMGNALFLMALLELPAMFSMSRLIRRVRLSVLLILACFAFAVKGFFYLRAETVAGFYGTQILQMLSFAVLIPASVYYTEQQILPEDRVTGQACMSLALSGGTVIGSAVSGILIDKAGLEVMLIAGILIALAGGALACISCRKEKAGRMEISSETGKS